MSTWWLVTPESWWLVTLDEGPWGEGCVPYVPPTLPVGWWLGRLIALLEHAPPFGGGTEVELTVDPKC